MTDSNIQRNQELNNLREQERSIAAANQNASIARIVHIIYFLFGVLELLLLIRFTLQLIGANDGNSFASFINALSAPFVVLFATLVKNPVLSNTAVFEMTTLIAMFVYAILSWLIGRLVWLLLSRPR